MARPLSTYSRPEQVQQSCSSEKPVKQPSHLAVKDLTKHHVADCRENAYEGFQSIQADGIAREQFIRLGPSVLEVSHRKIPMNR
jgi:hypothetical protein